MLLFVVDKIVYEHIESFYFVCHVIFSKTSLLYLVNM